MDERRQNIEIEIKLRLESFCEYLKLVGFLGNPDRELHQVNCFFDSEDHRLMADGWAFRVRTEDNRGLVTLKGAASTAHPVAVVREEIEAEIDRGAAADIINLQSDILTIAVEPVTFVKKKWPGIALSKLVQFTNTRQFKNYKIGDYVYVLELDRTEYADGSIDYELEMELDQPQQAEVVIPSLQKLFASLDIPFEQQDESKFARALAKVTRF
ncbi:MAG: CYTH domain-containing protein [candidate division Zixibacteria bacterium]|jgi:uncharacterized protein YjbK|nr:CYTH domain-containing protein [candidate division Zixibacteria bacterium]